MIVADSNLIASCILQSEATQAALELRARDSDWKVPRLWRYEVQNILATMIKTGRITRAAAQTAYAGAFGVLQAHETDPAPENVLALVEAHGISGYDAQFVALAEQLACPLYTQDRELLKKFPRIAKRYYNPR